MLNVLRKVEVGEDVRKRGGFRIRHGSGKQRDTRATARGKEADALAQRRDALDLGADKQS